MYGIYHYHRRDFSMTRSVPATAFAIMTMVSVTVMADEIKCGLKEGDPAAAFRVLDVTGPKKGETLCYR